MNRNVLAIAAHPDDIEFVMSGTLMHLVQRGWKAHYLNIANGCCGSMEWNPDKTASIRLEEARRAAVSLQAEFNPPLCDDLQIRYSPELLAQVTAIVRRANPSIVLTHSPIDYMADHEQACQLAVGAAFVKGVPNFSAMPPVPAVAGDVAIYHAQPHGNRTPLGDKVLPSLAVDVSCWRVRKGEVLSLHASQKDWLDATQGMESYVRTMENLGEELGSWLGLSGLWEGWRQRVHLGYGPQGWDPLGEALQHCAVKISNKP
jgi:LmbE family N-acetylglucosaminyl deacetylase